MFHARCALALLAVVMTTACAGPAKPPDPEPMPDKMEAFLARHPEPIAPRAAPSAKVAASAESAAERSPRVDMSKQLGGMRLSMTVVEFRSACVRGGGTLLDREKNGIDLVCTVVPVPLETAGRVHVDLAGGIMGRFCGEGATVCELMYFVDGSPLRRNDQIDALVELFSGKYGPPSATEGYPDSDPMRPCSLGKPTHFKRSWYFGPKQTPPHPFGWARIVFDCDASNGAISDNLTIFYDDEYGLRFRAAEYNDRRENF